MPNTCQLCENETDLFFHGYPLCLDCDQNLRAKGSTFVEKLAVLKRAAVKPDRPTEP